jgi:hypothetical protein
LHLGHRRHASGADPKIRRDGGLDGIRVHDHWAIRWRVVGFRLRPPRHVAGPRDRDDDRRDIGDWGFG